MGIECANAGKSSCKFTSSCKTTCSLFKTTCGQIFLFLLGIFIIFVAPWISKITLCYIGEILSYITQASLQFLGILLVICIIFRNKEILNKKYVKSIVGTILILTSPWWSEPIAKHFNLHMTGIEPGDASNIVQLISQVMGLILVVYELGENIVKSILNREIRHILEEKSILKLNSEIFRASVSGSIVKEKISQIFESAREMSSVFPVEEAMKFIWDAQGQGRIPLFKDLDYHIHIESCKVDCQGNSHTTEDFKFKVGYISHHGFDVRSRSQEDDISRFVEQISDDLLFRLVRPIVVLPYKRYVKYSHMWDRSRFTVVYLVTEEEIEELGKSEEDKKKVGRHFRRHNWVSSLTPNMLARSSDDIRGLYGEEEDGIRMQITCDGIPSTALSIKFESVYDRSGEFKYGKDGGAKMKAEADYLRYMDELRPFSIDDSIREWNRELSIVGMYVPYIEKKPGSKEEPGNCELELNRYMKNLNRLYGKNRSIDISRIKIYSMWCYSLGDMDFFNFPVGNCAFFKNIRITLSKYLRGDRFPPCTLYSFFPYSSLPPSAWTPHKDGDEWKYADIAVESESASSATDDEKLLFPSDVFSIRWSVENEETETQGSENRDTGTSQANAGEADGDETEQDTNGSA